MIGVRNYAFALAAVLALFCPAPPAGASPFDGAWNMMVVTTDGHCGTIRVGLAIRGGRITSTSGKFVLRPIRLSGVISGSGHAELSAVAGPRKAKGNGRFSGSRATGKWAGTGPSGVCSGIWSAVRL